MFKGLDMATLRREVASEVKSRTSAFADKFYGKVAEVEKPRKSEKVSKLEELIATGAFGCNALSVAKALSIVLGEEIAYRQPVAEQPRIDPFPMGIALVTADGKIGYQSTWGFEKPVVNGVINGNAAYFMDASGRQGQMSGRKINSRPATAKEIDTLIAAVPEAAVLSIAVVLLGEVKVPLNANSVR